MTQVVKILLYFLLTTQVVSAQYFQKNLINEKKLNIWNFGAQLSLNIPLQDFSKRFGNLTSLGGSVMFKSESDWLVSAEYSYLFGYNIKEKGIFDSINVPITNSTERYLINGRGEFQIMDIEARGHHPQITIGKRFSKLGPNLNSGMVAQLGAGYLIHYINYYYAGDPPPQLNGNYEKGYDRRTEGLTVTARISYLNYSKNKLANFQVFSSLSRGFTYNVRAYNFDTQTKDYSLRNDYFLSIGLNWFFTFYQKDGFDNEFH